MANPSRDALLEGYLRKRERENRKGLSLMQYASARQNLL